MRVLLSPQVPSAGDSISYEFKESIIEVEINYRGKRYEGSFDFRGLPNGRLNEELLEKLVYENNFPVNPLLQAEKKQGLLYVELLNWVDINANDSENYPEWFNSEDYKEYLKAVKQGSSKTIRNNSEFDIREVDF